jgi:hypothetical protein
MAVNIGAGPEPCTIVNDLEHHTKTILHGDGWRPAPIHRIAGARHGQPPREIPNSTAIGHASCAPHRMHSRVHGPHLYAHAFRNAEMDACRGGGGHRPPRDAVRRDGKRASGSLHGGRASCRACASVAGPGHQGTRASGHQGIGGTEQRSSGASLIAPAARGGIGTRNIAVGTHNGSGENGRRGIPVSGKHVRSRKTHSSRPANPLRRMPVIGHPLYSEALSRGICRRDPSPYGCRERRVCLGESTAASMSPASSS